MAIFLFSVFLVIAEARVIFVSFDGFRWDYLLRHGKHLPTFSKFVAEGVQVHYGLRNSFVTKTFPNHRTLVTGLWEENHGIVGNHFWDPKAESEFLMSSEEDFFWNQAEPFWVVAERNNVTTACVLYPGCEVPSQKPTYTLGLKYSSDYPFRSLVDNLTLSLDREDNPAQLGLLYYFEPDHTGHLHGPQSNEIKNKLIELDGHFEYLLSRLKDSDNIIITSDHGMADIPLNHTINLKNYVDTNLTEHSYFFATEVLLYVNETNEAEVMKQLKVATKNNAHITVYKKDEIPERWHYTHNDRIPSILVVASEGWIITDSDEPPYGGKSSVFGQHGFDNMLLDMHPLLIARGPAFKKGLTHYDLVKSVDMFALVGNLTGFPSEGRNGSLSRVLPLLKGPDDQITFMGRIPLQYVVLLTILCLAIFVYITYMVLIALQRSQPRYKSDSGGKSVVATKNDVSSFMLTDELEDYDDDDLFGDRHTTDRQSKQPFLPR